MLYNASVWDYYPKNDSKYLSPMYAPYQPWFSRAKDGQICPAPSPFAPQGYSDGFVNEGLVRKGWGLSFMLKHTDDPCPAGWTKESDGMCYENEPEFGSYGNGLYSENAFVPKYQYWNGYTQSNKNAFVREINEFDNRSINPFTGEMISYITSYPAQSTTGYGKLRSKDSLIA